jgi:hypothetical protein
LQWQEYFSINFEIKPNWFQYLLCHWINDPDKSPMKEEKESNEQQG